MVTTQILTKIVEFYLKGQLPSDMTVHSVKYRKTSLNEYYLVSNIPEWQPTSFLPLPPNCSREQITLEPVMVGEQIILAGYGEVSKTLMIGQEADGGFEQFDTNE